MNEGKYIYCIIEGRVDKEFDLTGIGGYGKVYFIDYNDITAAVSDVPLAVFDPSRVNAMTHEKVIQNLMVYYNLVPCNFGNNFKSKADLMKFLASACEYVAENLRNVRGMMEVGLRVFWKKQYFAEEIETQRIKDLRDSLVNQPETQNYYSKMELGKMVEEQVDLRRQHYIANIYEPLAKRAKDARLNDTVNPMMIFNAAFLIPKSKEQEFDTYVGTIISKYEGRLELSYSGPWPPYNFTSITPNK